MHRAACTILLTAATCLPALIARGERLEADLLIAGGTESACAAAAQAARMGVASIVLVSDIGWLGGQFSAEALVAIDENRGPQGYGHGVPFPRAGLFKEVLDRIEAANQGKYGHPRPGNTRVITTCRPSDAEAVFRELLEPYVRSGQLRIVSDYYPVAATFGGDGRTLASVRFRSTHDGREDLEVAARLTIDATDWGDVIKAAGAAYEFGPDLKSKYNEPLAPVSRDDYPLTDMNPITYCMVIEETDSYEPIPRPQRYDPRNYRQHAYPKDPLWLYASRRVIDHYHFDRIDHPDVLLLCFPAFDYPLDVWPRHVAEALEAAEPRASRKNIVELERRQRQIVLDDAKQYSLGFLYYLQTEVHDQMPDQRHSFRRFVLSSEFGTPDRLPPKPYVRESLRLRAMYMMRQQDTMGHGGLPTNYATVMYHDGVACWQFEFDFHPTGRRFLDGDPAGPWTNYFRKNRTWGPPYSGRALFPLRSMVPRRIDGLLGAQKNLGYSSIVSSAVRLHDQSMAIGQAAGGVAAVCLRRDVRPRAVPYDARLLAEVWGGLCARHDGGQPQMLWPFRDLEPQHAAFEAVNLLAARRGLPLRSFEIDFRADEPASEVWKRSVVERTLASKQAATPPEMPAGDMTRGEFARAWWELIRDLPERPWHREKLEDADADGTADQDDALLFEPDGSSWPTSDLPPDQDGHPETADLLAERIEQFNFTGPDSPPDAGFINDHGLPFDGPRGYGWSRDIRQNHRRRNRAEGAWRDTFLFTRSHHVWQRRLADGRYRVTVCIGDAGFRQAGQNVTVQGIAVFRDRDTELGWFAEGTVEVEVHGGRLEIEIGRPGSSTNTCLNWVRIQPLADQ